MLIRTRFSYSHFYSLSLFFYILFRYVSCIYSFVAFLVYFIIKHPCQISFIDTICITHRKWVAQSLRLFQDFPNFVETFIFPFHYFSLLRFWPFHLAILLCRSLNEIWLVSPFVSLCMNKTVSLSLKFALIIKFGEVKVNGKIDFLKSFLLCFFPRICMYSC